MMYVLLLLTILLMWAVVYPLTDYEILSPPSLILLMFAFATILSIIGCLFWNDIQLSIEAYFVISVGCLGIVAAAIIFRRFSQVDDEPKRKNRGVSAIERIANASSGRWAVLIVFVLFAAAINLGEMLSLAHEAGYSGTSFMDTAQWARGNISSLLTSGAGDSDESYSAISSALNKVITFCGYAAVIGIAAKIKMKKRKLLGYFAVSMLLLLASGFSLLKGGRDTIAHYIVAFLIALFAFYILDSENRKKTSLKFLKIGIVAVLVALPLFYLALEVVGRTRSVSLFDYVSFYFGGGIPSLSYAIDTFPVNYDDAFSGEKTFTQLYALMNKIGLVGPVDAYADTFIKLNGHSSNIFTCFYRYYCDFGYIGVFLFSGLATLVFCACFSVLKNSPSMTLKIVAVYICSYTADVAREEFIFSRLLSASLVWAIVASVFIAFILLYSRKTTLSLSVQRKSEKLNHDSILL